MTEHPEACRCPLCLLRKDVRGWASALQGSAQPSARGVVQASGQYLAGTIDTATAQGTLGRTASMQLGGVFDLRPRLRMPAKDDHEWFRRVHGVRGKALTLRVEDRRAPTVWPTEQESLAYTDVWRPMAISVLVSGFDSFPEDGQDADPRTRDPFSQTNQGWVVARNARFGPNLVPELATRGVAEVDLTRWAGNARFLVAWLAAYWLVEDPAEPLDLRWTLWDEPDRSEDWGPVTVSVPILSVPNGAWVAANDANALWRQGSYPLHGRAQHKLSVVNGGAFGVTLETRWSSGPMTGLGTWTGPTDVFALAAGRSVERAPVAGSDGCAMMGVWGTNTNAEAAAGGPIILTDTQGCG